MKDYSTGYTFMFAGAVCLVCSVFVAGAAVSLKDTQEANKVLDRQKKVLSVVGLMKDGEELSPAQVQELYSANVVPRVVDLASGEYLDEVDPASVDMRKALTEADASVEAPENPAKVLRLPKQALVYQIKKGKKVDKLVLPVEGKGLWSTLYGFIALEKDLTTIAGLTFYEHGETPGLGGEVDNPNWKGLWKGRKAFDDDGNPAVEVIKGQAGGPGDDPYHVDGLSGATITSRGVTYLVQFWLGENGFGPYLENTASGS